MQGSTWHSAIVVGNWDEQRHLTAELVRFDQMFSRQFMKEKPSTYKVQFSNKNFEPIKKSLEFFPPGPYIALIASFYVSCSRKWPRFLRRSKKSFFCRHTSRAEANRARDVSHETFSPNQVQLTLMETKRAKNAFSKVRKSKGGGIAQR